MNHSRCSTSSIFSNPSSSHLFYSRQGFFLFLSAEETLPHATKPSPWIVPFDAEPSSVISLAANDDTRDIPISSCLARSPTSFCRGVIALVLVMMMSQMLELMMIMLQTSLLLGKLGIQGPHKIGAYFDQDFPFFSLIFLYFNFSSLILVIE